MRLGNPLRGFLKRRETRVPGAPEDRVVDPYQQGNLLIASRQFEAALASYDQAIGLDPNHAPAYCNRGVALENLGRWDDAYASYTRAILIRPDDAVAHYNRAAVHRVLGRVEEALRDYDRAIELKPDYAHAYCNRATLLETMGRPDAALADYEQAIEIDPRQGDPHAKRGIVLTVLHRWEQALAAFNQALSLEPERHESLCNRGRVLALLGRPDEALADFDAAIELRPDYAYAFYRRAETLSQQQKLSAAIASYDRAIALNPTFPVLGGMRRFAQMKICDWTRWETDVAQFTTGLEQGVCVSPPLPTLALLEPARLHHRSALSWTGSQCPPDDALGPIPARARAERIRIGYFSADFRDHAVAHMTAAIFEGHDRSKFEVFAFAFLPRTEDAMRGRLERAFDRFTDVGERTDREIAELARECGIDIAVDLGGFTAHSRPRVFALRAAPIQINYLGYPGSMGAPYMDYLIADRVVIPAGAERHYSEKILRLPHSFFPGDPTRAISDDCPSREALGLPAAAFVFCCFNNAYKITPRTFDSWMRILTRVAASVLWLSRSNPEAEANLRQAAAARGVDPRRLVFADRVPALEDHLARYRSADLFLDTRPYNAHATALDALWAGLPVLTCVGEGFAGRVAASLLEALGLAELVTQSAAEYEELSVRLAEDPVRLARFKQRLAERRLAAPLFDLGGYTRDLEAAYLAVFDRLVARLPPDHIDLNRGLPTPSVD